MMTRHLRLEVEVTRLRNSYEVRFGQVVGRGATRAEAELDLGDRLRKIVTEESRPYFRLTADGSVWRAYRDTWGAWCYETGTGCVVVGQGRREETIAALEAHISQVG